MVSFECAGPPEGSKAMTWQSKELAKKWKDVKPSPQLRCHAFVAEPSICHGTVFCGGILCMFAGLQM